MKVVQGETSATAHSTGRPSLSLAQSSKAPVVVYSKKLPMAKAGIAVNYC